ncbi:MAG: glycosyltransferase family 4 protein [Candidatus Andersenbacteria bacterium]|nr:glycosyltransferase family 4 protein [Candidatus Andersenbacteria bacterium]
MKILFLSGLYPPMTRGGGELSTHYIAQGLVARGHEVTVLAEGDKRVESHLNGVRVFRAPLGLLAKPLFEKIHSRHIAHAIKREMGDLKRFDVIHAQDFRSALALAHLKLPHTVVTARDYAQISGCTNNILANGSINPGCADDPWHCHRLAEVGSLRRMARFWQYQFNIGFRHQAFQSFPKHIFISRAQQVEIDRHQKLPGVKTAVIYNPVAAEYLSQPAEGRPGNILYMGRTEMYKGLGILLEAFALLAQEDKTAQLTIAGQGAQRNDYEAWVAKHSLQYRVKFLGHMPYDRVMSVYDDAQVLAAPNLWIEPFGRNVVEAMARGKMVVAARIGGPAEIMAASQTGVLFDRGSVTQLAQALGQALAMDQHTKREQAQRARAWVTQNLTIDKIAEQYEQFYLG